MLGHDVILKAEQQVGVRDDDHAVDGKGHRLHPPRAMGWNGISARAAWQQIPIPGRMMAIVDVYDAVHTRTLYSAPLSSDGAEKMIVKGRGTHFDPAVVDAFQAIVPLFRQVSAEAHDEGPAEVEGPAEAGHYVPRRDA